jgi:DNA polymerase I-like protein with 3'-5' exonuclease and polymerase domains
LKNWRILQCPANHQSHILALRDIAKKIGVLKTSIDPDGRMRTSYNIAGTTTGRFSSSLSDFGTGGNLQNLEERLRRPFVADPGMKFAYIDLEQAESRLVGAIEWNLFGDGRYLDACESGDLHTSVCRLAWTELPWTEILKEIERLLTNLSIDSIHIDIWRRSSGTELIITASPSQWPSTPSSK